MSERKDNHPKKPLSINLPESVKMGSLDFDGESWWPSWTSRLFESDCSHCGGMTAIRTIAPAYCVWCGAKLDQKQAREVSDDTQKANANSVLAELGKLLQDQPDTFKRLLGELPIG